MKDYVFLKERLNDLHKKAINVLGENMTDAMAIEVEFKKPLLYKESEFDGNEVIAGYNHDSKTVKLRVAESGTSSYGNDSEVAVELFDITQIIWMIEQVEIGQFEIIEEISEDND